MNISDNLFVAIDYKLTLPSGEEVDQSPAGKPLGFVIGAGQMIPGLEKELIGKAVGDKLQIQVEPEDAYGPVREDMFQEIPREQFPADVDIQPGMTFEAQGAHGPVLINVVGINENNTIKVDLNHPLAGQQLHFDVHVVEVREPKAGELVDQSGSCGCGCGSSGKETCEPKDGCGSGCSCG